MSTVGYGDIQPTTDLETFFTMLIIFIGISIYASVTGNIASLAANMDVAAGSYQHKLDEIKAFFNVNNKYFNMKKITI
jgi:hypothetical protein